MKSKHMQWMTFGILTVAAWASLPAPALAGCRILTEEEMADVIGQSDRAFQGVHDRVEKLLYNYHYALVEDEGKKVEAQSIPFKRDNPQGELYRSTFESKGKKAVMHSLSLGDDDSLSELYKASLAFSDTSGNRIYNSFFATSSPVGRVVSGSMPKVLPGLERTRTVLKETIHLRQNAYRIDKALSRLLSRSDFTTQEHHDAREAIKEFFDASMPLINHYSCLDARRKAKQQRLENLGKDFSRFLQGRGSPSMSSDDVVPGFSSQEAQPQSGEVSSELNEGPMCLPDAPGVTNQQSKEPPSLYEQASERVSGWFSSSGEAR